MQPVDFLVYAFIALHGAAILSVMNWVGKYLGARGKIGNAQIQAREAERKARVPALILAGVLAACYAVLFVIQARLGK